MPQILISEYNGKPTVGAYRDEDDRYPFAFGGAKWAKLLEALMDDPSGFKKIIEVSEPFLSAKAKAHYCKATPAAPAVDAMLERLLAK